jgi:hypothetical protein
LLKTYFNFVIHSVIRQAPSFVAILALNKPILLHFLRACLSFIVQS